MTTEQQMRADFENWVGNGFPMDIHKDSNGKYQIPGHEQAWAAWQEALTTQTPLKADVEKVADAIWEVIKGYSTRKHAELYARAAIAAIGEKQ